MLGSSDRPVSPRGSRSRRMINDDSVQIAATRPARRRALTRVRRGDGASGVAWKRGSRCGGIGNYPLCKGSRIPKREKNPNSRAARQSFEPTRFGRRIAAREGSTAKRSRPEMAPQRLDKIESAPGNGRVSEASTHKIWYTGARLPRPTPNYVDTTSFTILRRRFGSSDDTPWARNKHIDFSTGKPKPVGPSFHVAERSPPFAAPGGL
jgi:hypothetical protein